MCARRYTTPSALPECAALTQRNRRQSLRAWSRRAPSLPCSESWPAHTAALQSCRVGDCARAFAPSESHLDSLSSCADCRLQWLQAGEVVGSLKGVFRLSDGAHGHNLLSVLENRPGAQKFHFSPPILAHPAEHVRKPSSGGTSALLGTALRARPTGSGSAAAGCGGSVSAATAPKPSRCHPSAWAAHWPA